MNSIQHDWKDLGLLILVFGLLPIALDAYLAIIPVLETVFPEGTRGIQLGFSAFLSLFGIFQLFFGILSDRIGRRKVILTGLICYEVGSLLGLFSHSVLMLLLARAIQMVGCSMAVVSAIAAIKDIYQKKASIIYAYFMSCSAIFALVSFNLSSFLASHFDWRSVFLFFILFVGVVLIAFIIRFKETLLVKNKQKFWNTQRINLLKNPFFIVSSVLLVVGYVVLMSLVSITPHLVVKVFSIELKSVGLYLSVFPITVVMSSSFSAYLIKKRGEFFLGIIGVGLLFIGLLIMNYFNQLDILSLWGYFIPVSIIIISSIFLVNAGQGGGMRVCQESDAGFASSVLGCFRYGLGGVLCSIPVFLDAESTYVLLVLLSICCSLACFALWALYRFYYHRYLELS